MSVGGRNFLTPMRVVERSEKVKDYVFDTPSGVTEPHWQRDRESTPHLRPENAGPAALNDLKSRLEWHLRKSSGDPAYQYGVRCECSCRCRKCAGEEGQIETFDIESYLLFDIVIYIEWLEKNRERPTGFGLEGMLDERDIAILNTKSLLARLEQPHHPIQPVAIEIPMAERLFKTLAKWKEGKEIGQKEERPSRTFETPKDDVQAESRARALMFKMATKIQQSHDPTEWNIKEGSETSQVCGHDVSACEFKVVDGEHPSVLRRFLKLSDNDPLPDKKCLTAEELQRIVGGSVVESINFFGLILQSGLWEWNEGLNEFTMKGFYRISEEFPREDIYTDKEMKEKFGLREAKEDRVSLDGHTIEVITKDAEERKKTRELASKLKEDDFLRFCT